MQSVSTRSRRRNGEASFGQRPDGRWQAKVSLPDGSRRSVYGKTREDVEAKVLDIRQGVQRGLPVEPTGVTIASYFNRWLTSRKSDLRPNTWLNYEGNLRLHIVPHLGSKKPSRLEPTDVRVWHQALKAEGLAPKSVVLAHATLRAGLAQAMTDGVVHRNVASLVHPPTVPKAKVKPYSPWRKSASSLPPCGATRSSRCSWSRWAPGCVAARCAACAGRHVDFPNGLLYVRGQWRVSLAVAGSGSRPRLRSPTTW